MSTTSFIRSVQFIILVAATSIDLNFSFTIHKKFVSFHSSANHATNSISRSRPVTLWAGETSQANEDGATEVIDFERPEDAVVNIKPLAMKRLRELKIKEAPEPKTLILRMGVRNGGCSGLSYVMDFSDEESINEEDAVDEYVGEGIKCVVDAKSLLYLYGLELDYSEELIGGGFKFFNPNAEESCGCGSSFGV